MHAYTRTYTVTEKHIWLKTHTNIHIWLWPVFFITFPREATVTEPSRNSREEAIQAERGCRSETRACS